MSRSPRSPLGWLLLFTLALPGALLAQSYPAKPIRLVVGFTPGGGVDINARLLAAKLSEYLGQPVIVENRPGAGTNIANEFVAKAAPDGYTLLMSTATVAINMALYKKLNFDTLRDFTAVSQFSASPNILVVNAAVPVTSLAQLSALAFEPPLAAPGADRLGEHVVEDLEPVRAVDAVHDSVARQLREHSTERLLGDIRVLGEVGSAMRDLRPRRSDEMLEHARRNVLLSRCEPAERTQQVVPHDRLRAAECTEGLESEDPRARGALCVPDALEDELEIGGLDPVSSPSARLDGAFGEHRVDERIFAADGFSADELVPALEWAEDRAARGVAVEVVEAHLVREHGRNSRLERIEPRDRILSKRDQDVDPRVAQQLGQVVQQRADTVVAAVVEEVLLELVEDQIGLGRAPRLVEDAVERTRPAVSEDDSGLRSGGAQISRDRGREQRRLADAALAVEDGEP